MGSNSVRELRSDAEVRAFTHALLRDLDALERMLDEGVFDPDGPRHIGLEQEMFLVTEVGRPAPVAANVLARLDDRFTSELARFNLEANLPPIPLSPSFLAELGEQLKAAVGDVDEAARSDACCVLLTGILPTLRRDDLEPHNMSPQPRYAQLNDALMRFRGGHYPVVIQGIDEFETVGHNVMLESANTSLQLHLQVAPADFARVYNIAQWISAPLLAIGTNSPFLLGKRLWRETRVALFERSVDSRSTAEKERGLRPRVSFGDRWVDDSVLEIFRDDAARYRPLLYCDGGEDPLAALDDGRLPALPTLALHNGTVWRWNRACFGTGDLPHLRVENRVLPAGPTLEDELANAAFFYGMMLALEARGDDPRDVMPFDEAKSNFLAAAHRGLEASLYWPDRGRVSARQLILHELIPLARSGLQAVGAGDRGAELLDVIEARTKTGQTGSRWALDAFASFRRDRNPGAAVHAVTRAMLEHQKSGLPVHAWPLPRDTPLQGLRPVRRTIGDIMTTDLFTVRPEDAVDLARSVMRWRKIRHVPVEDEDGVPLGVISYRLMVQEAVRASDDGDHPAAQDLMDADPLLLEVDTDLAIAARKLLASRHGCILVTRAGRLVGIATERDFLRAATPLLDRDA